LFSFKRTGVFISPCKGIMLFSWQGVRNHCSCNCFSFDSTMICDGECVFSTFLCVLRSFYCGWCC
jgi:hypothetical protein